MPLKMLTDVVEYAGVVERKSKSGNLFKLVSFGNRNAYEKYDFFLRDDVRLEGLQEGQKVKLLLELSKYGYNNQYDLIEVQRVQG